MNGSGFFKQKSETYERLEYFHIIIRFIDDRCNNYNIYTDEHEFKTEIDDLCKSSFQPLSIEVHDRLFTTKMLDKRATFPFHFNHMLYLDNNTPAQILYAYGSEHVCIILLLKKVFRKYFEVIHNTQIQLMNLSSSFLCNYFYLCVYVYFICMYMYTYVFYVCYLCLNVFRLQCICAFNWCEHLDSIGT